MCAVRSDNQSVISRPGYRVWGVAFAFAAMAFVMGMVTGNSAGNRTETLWGGAMTLLCAGIAVGALSHALWTVVCADARGLYWRRLFQPSRSAPWASVTDYYLRHGASADMEVVIQTDAGMIVLAADWRGLAAVKEAVSRHATSASTGTWDLLGTRPGDSSRTFTYDTPANRRDAILLPVVAILIGGGFLFLLGWTVAGVAELRRVAAPAVMAAVLLCVIALLVVGGAASLLALNRETNRRRGRHERITASPDGLQFESDERSVSARWEEIAACVRGTLPGAWLDSPRFIVRTRHGEFDFLATIENHFHLKKWIAAQAPADVTAWRDAGAEVIRVNPDRWPSAGEDSRVFHYRTRSNRALLVFVGAVCGVLVVEAGFKGEGYALAALSAAVVAWFAWRYHRTAIRVDSRGITHFGALGSRFLPWNAIRQTRIRQSGRDGLNRESVRGDGRTIVFWDIISDVEALRAEIRRRAPGR
jgi:hypothetical protein